MTTTEYETKLAELLASLGELVGTHHAELGRFDEDDNQNLIEQLEDAISDYLPDSLK